MVESIEEIAHLNDLCGRLGMDTITAGNLCAFVMEAAERGKIDEPVVYGDADAIEVLLNRIARREGIGDVLANGIIFAARQWGLEDIAVHVKGLEPAGYDPRVLKGMGLAYATADRGACHLRATVYKPELSGVIPPGQVRGKAKIFVDFEDRATLFDALMLCRFYRDFYDWGPLQTIIHMTTGLDMDKEGLQSCAAGISDMVRRFNLREGMQPEEDALSAGLLRRLNDAEDQLTIEELSYMLKEYYDLRGWDEKGRPPVPDALRDLVRCITATTTDMVIPEAGHDEPVKTVYRAEARRTPRKTG